MSLLSAAASRTSFVGIGTAAHRQRRARQSSNSGMRRRWQGRSASILIACFSFRQPSHRQGTQQPQKRGNPRCTREQAYGSRPLQACVLEIKSERARKRKTSRRLTVRSTLKPRRINERFSSAFLEMHHNDDETAQSLGENWVSLSPGRLK